MRLGISRRYLLLPILFNITLEVLDTVVKKKENDIKHPKVTKDEIKLSLFTGNIIVHIENPKRST